MHGLSPYQKQFEGVQKLVARWAMFVENKGGRVGSDAARLNVTNPKMGTRESVNEGKTQTHRVTNCGLKEEDTTDRCIGRKLSFG
jgi:hypothetical protein